MPLTVIRRKDTNTLQVSGIVAGQRIRRRAQSDDMKIAREEAAALEAEILRTAWHGERRGARRFAEAALSYLEAEPRSANHKAAIGRLLRALGDVSLAQVDQSRAVELKTKLLRPGHAPGTYTRVVLMPLRAIMLYAHRLGWCDMPHFVVPRENPGRTRFLLPSEADRLIGAAAPHLRPLLIFLLGTGARMAEAVELDWRDVDLAGKKATFWRTKSGRRRVAELPARAIIVLANLPGRTGAVFRRPDGQPYADRERRYGGQIKTAWAGAVRRAGLDAALTPHDCRHTWASWHYATHRDPLRLKNEGGWSSLNLIERYTHLLPAGQVAAIAGFLGHAADTDPVTSALSA